MAFDNNFMGTNIATIQQFSLLNWNFLEEKLLR